VLDEVIPYLSGDIPDKADHPSITEVFDPSDEKSSLYEHLIRAVEHSLSFGAHGLPLMGTADWNDGMNRVGIEGGGESVWLAWLTITVLDEMSALTLKRGDPERAARYRLHAAQYREALKKFGWDGRWYRRAFTDTGALVGTSGAKAFRLDSITQSWAYFANGETKETREALRSAKDELSIYEGHVPLAWPPSSRSILDLGTISDYPPGVRENASQYNHAALWFAQALFASGDPDAGKIIIDAVNPFKRSDTIEKLLVYRGEPHVVAAEVYSTPTYPGRAGWTWYTASAGAMYRTVLEYILGLKREGNTLSFSPSLPSGWHEASVTLPFGQSRYHIKFEVKSDLVSKMHVALDGVHAANGGIELRDDGKEHEIIVSIKRITPPDLHGGQ
jgi:cellobiose phosphorylase